ncbi:MAG: hypothetical protein RLN70_03745, partial [Rhodospirillaceae bacterium]
AHKQGVEVQPTGDHFRKDRAFRPGIVVFEAQERRIANFVVDAVSGSRLGIKAVADADEPDFCSQTSGDLKFVDQHPTDQRIGDGGQIGVDLSSYKVALQARDNFAVRKLLRAPGSDFEAREWHKECRATRGWIAQTMFNNVYTVGLELRYQMINQMRRREIGA